MMANPNRVTREKSKSKLLFKGRRIRFGMKVVTTMWFSRKGIIIIKSASRVLIITFHAIPLALQLVPYSLTTITIALS